MNTERFMKVGIALLIIALAVFVAGCTEKEKTFVTKESDQNYITFTPETSRVFMHYGTVDAVFQGSYVETENDYSIFTDNSREQVIFKKFSDGSIGLLPDCDPRFYPAK